MLLSRRSSYTLIEWTLTTRAYGLPHDSWYFFTIGHNLIEHIELWTSNPAAKYTHEFLG